MPLPPPIPAESGLAGAPMPGADMTANANMAEQPEEPTVAGPAVTKVEPEPHESIARHILDALGGSDKSNPMGWAKSIIAGSLAGAANVGEVHGGQGFLAGAGRAAQGIALQKRQAALDQQRVQQQQFENQEKLKADARAEKELANASDRTKAEVALHNANILAAIHADQRAQALAPFMEAEAKAKLQQVQTAQDESRVNLKKVLIESGMSPKDAEESVTSYENAPSGAAKDIANGSMLLTHNGETAKQEEDGVGVHASPNAQSLWDTKIKKDTQVLSGFQYDEKKGFVPQYTTVSAGTSVGTIVAMHDAAHDYLQQQQKQLTDAAELKQKQAQLAHTQAETEQIRANMSQGPQKDVLGAEFTPPPGGVKETNKVRDSFKKDADSLAKTEGTFNQFQDVLNDINAGKGMTGAQSVVALFNAIGISAEPLQGKGFRINHSTVEEHQEARGLGDTLYQKLLKLKEGDVITPQQVKDYADIAMRSRHDAYVNKINEARAAGINPDFLLPRGNGHRIDANTAQIFYDTAAGNTPQEKAANAKKAAGATGWQF